MVETVKVPVFRATFMENLKNEGHTRIRSPNGRAESSARMRKAKLDFALPFRQLAFFFKQKFCFQLLLFPPATLT